MNNIFYWLTKLIEFFRKKQTLNRRIRKRNGYIYIVICCCILTLAVFGAKAQQPVTIKVLVVSAHTPIFRSVLVDAFEKQNPSIHVEANIGPFSSDQLNDLYTSAFLLGDSPYDLIYMDVVWTSKFAAAGWLEELTNLISPEELKLFSAKDVEAGKFENKLYRLPVSADAGMIYYRKDLLEENGLSLPRTFEDIEQISKSLQKDEKVKWGYLWQGAQYEGVAAMFVEVLHGFGGFWVNPDNLEVGLDRPESVKALEFLIELIQEGVTPPGVTTYQEEDTRRIFQAGEAAFLRNWSYVWSLANQTGSSVDGKIGIMPMLSSSSNIQGASCLGGWGLGISKQSHHKEEALKALKFFTSGPSKEQYIMESGFVPSQEKLFTNPNLVSKYPYLTQMKSIVNRTILRPSIAEYNQVSDILQRYLTAAFAQNITPKDAMNAAARETRRVLKS